MPRLGFRFGAALALTAFVTPVLLTARPAPRHGVRAITPDSMLVRALTFRSIGPALMGGRIVDIAVAENPPAVRGGRLGTVIYIAAATGGIWKSVNGGVRWDPVFDSVRTGSIGALAVSPSNSEIVWVGTGEANNMRSSSWGTGVYKSVDGGKTWSGAMLPGSQHIGRIAIDPRDPNVVYVAAVGPLWAPGGERGLYKTTDGGKTWTNTMDLGKFTGFTDVALDPSDPDVVYAAAFERERREYGFLPAGPLSGIYKSTDGARSWTQLKQGLPTGEIGRIGLTVCRSRPATLYASVHASGDGNGIYRTDDAGATWRKVSGSNGTAWYYGQMRCDPTDPDHVVKLNVGSQESWDGGRTWTGFAGGGGVHADHHALWINPEAPEQEILGNDGGLYFSWDRGKTWDHRVSFVISQFYAIAVDDARPFYNVYGGLQDNSSYGGPSRTRNSYGPTNAEWFRMVGGDGFYSVPDRWDNNVVYSESQEGGLVRYEVRTGQSKSIRPEAPRGVTYRYNWSAPILASRHAPGTVYFAANVLFRSADRGDTWETISPDLTRDIDQNTLPMRGAVPDSNTLGRNEGTAQFSNITTIDESPLKAGLLVVGTDDGLIRVSRDAGRTWSRTEHFPGVPDTTYVSRVAFSATQEGTIYATFDGHRSNDFAPYVYKSTDYGQSWKSITGDLPSGGATQVVREHPRQPNLLFVGTEFGVFFTVDGGTHWTQLKSGIPGVPVHDIAIQPRANDLVVGTHGRGIFILDDISPLEHLAEAKRASTGFLFPVIDALLFTPNSTLNSGMGTSGFAGENPPPGPYLTYLIGDVAPDTKAKLEILDASGTVVRELPATARAGLYRTTWDMRVGPPLTGPVPPPTENAAGGRGGRGGFGGFGGFGGRGGAATFQAVPGTYSARLTITPSRGSPTVMTRSFALTRDPMVAMTDAELRQLYGYRLNVATFQRSLRDAQAQVDTAQRAVADLRRLADSTKGASDAARRDLDALEKDIARLAADIGSAGGGRGGRGGGFGGGFGGRGGEQSADTAGMPANPIQRRAADLTDVMNANFPPSPEQRRLVQELPGELQRRVAEVSAIRKSRIPALERALGGK